jgi:hypothetical protein
MKKALIIIFVIVFAVGIYYQLNKPWGEIMRLAIKVVDDQGVPVADANVRGYLNDPRKNDDGGKVYNSITDLDGICKDWGLVYTFTECSVTKDGYYSSRYHSRLKNDDKYVPDLTMVLKKIRNSSPMQVRSSDIILPGVGKYYPFDLDIGDWVEPYGNGKKPHVYIYYLGHFKDLFTGTSILRIKDGDGSAGLQIAEFDEYSKFKSMYFAPTNNYTNVIEFVIQETKEEIIKDTKLKNNQYLIFKVQNSTNSTMYNYGKIYHPFKYGKNRDSGKYMLHFTYYYNPTPGDRNLEFDSKQNLIKTVNWRGKDNSDRFDP